MFCILLICSIFPNGISGFPVEIKNDSKAINNLRFAPSNATLHIEQKNILKKPKLPQNGGSKEKDSFDFKKLEAHDLVKKLSTLAVLNMKEVQPPDHLDAAPIEQDGRLNHNFKHELMIGHHVEFEQKKDQKPEDTLKKVFKLADSNKDGYLDMEELNSWMVFMVQSHLKDTQVENEEVFQHLDINKNGWVTWDEFSIHFLLAKGYSLEKAIQISKGDVYNEAAILPEEKERLIRYKFRWVEADELSEEREDGGEREGLDKEELLNFRHPEQSPLMIKKVALELLEKFDEDEDSIITEEEFADPPKFFRGQEYDSDNEKLLNERRLEFRNFMDLDRDGKVDLTELKAYVDPRNRNRMRVETENLIMLADDNGDKRLSLHEVLENGELILGSKMVDASRNFHDEF